MSADVVTQLWETLAPWVTLLSSGFGVVLLSIGAAIWKAGRRATKYENEHETLQIKVAEMNKILKGKDGTNGLNGRVKDIENELDHGARRMNELGVMIRDVDRKVEGIGKSMDKNFLDITSKLGEIKGRLGNA